MNNDNCTKVTTKQAKTTICRLLQVIVLFLDATTNPKMQYQWGTKGSSSCLASWLLGRWLFLSTWQGHRKDEHRSHFLQCLHSRGQLHKARECVPNYSRTNATTTTVRPQKSIFYTLIGSPNITNSVNSIVNDWPTIQKAPKWTPSKLELPVVPHGYCIFGLLLKMELSPFPSWDRVLLPFSTCMMFD